MNSLLRLWTIPFIALLILAALVYVFLSPFTVHTRVLASTGASLTLSVRVGPPTSKIKLTGSGFGASETVILTFDTTPLGSTTANASGTFSATESIPQTALPGTHQVQAGGVTSHLLAQASFLVQTNWSTDGYNAQHTHTNPYENVLNTSNVSKLVLGWSYKTTNSIQTSPVIANGIVYIGSTDSYLYALDAQTGTLKWKHKLGPILTPAAVASGMVYIGAEYGYLYALDALTGQLKWSYAIANGGLGSAPVIVGGTLYYDTGSFQLFALDAKTGVLKWAIGLDDAMINSTVAVSNGVLYVDLDSGHLAALDAQTGALKWDVFVSLNGVGSELVVAKGLIYVSNYDTLFALDTQTGGVIWDYYDAIPNSSISVAVAHDRVYAGMGSTLYAFNALTGQILWKYVAGSVIDPSPTVANGVVSFCSSDGNLYMLDAVQGTKVWSYNGYFALSSPVTVDGMVYAGSFSGALDAFRLSSTK